jgi:hypothetical protein
LKGTLLLKEKLSLALETYKEKLSLSVLKLYRNTWRNNSVPTGVGVYDMAVGKKVVSAFSGPADANSFDMITHMPSSTTIKTKQTAERDDLEVLYQMVRIIRKSKYLCFLRSYFP